MCTEQGTGLGDFLIHKVVGAGEGVIIEHVKKADFLSGTASDELFDGSAMKMKVPEAFYFYRELLNIHWFHTIQWEEYSYLNPNYNVSAATIWKWYDVDNLLNIGIEEIGSIDFNTLKCIKTINYSDFNNDANSWKLEILVPGSLNLRKTIKNQLACVANNFSIRVGISTSLNDLEVCSMQYNCRCFLHVILKPLEVKSSHTMYWCNKHRDEHKFVLKTQKKILTFQGLEELFQWIRKIFRR